MFDQVTIRVSDVDASRAFYTTLLGDDWGNFRIAPGPEPTRHLHVAFAARSRDEVDAFWRRGVAAGYESDGAPGLRPQYDERYYGAFLLDPDGNSVEAVHHRAPQEGDALVDHLWIGVRDLAAARRWWEAVAPVLRLRFATERPERFHLATRNRSFALVADGRRPTENLHLAFPVPDEAAVAAFRDAAVVAGLDHAGATVEAVVRGT